MYVYALPETERTESTDTRELSAPRYEHSGVRTPADESLSRRVSFDEAPPEFELGSSTGHSQSQASSLRQASVRDTHSPHPHEDGRGRSKGKRLSIGLIFDAVKERVRSASRAERDTPPHSLSRDGSPDQRNSSARRGRTREPKERTTLERVTEVLGLESEEENEAGGGWKEFRKGVYITLRD